MMKDPVTELSLGYSPCPNDTFIFYAMTHDIVSIPGLCYRTELHDVETLNQMAFAQKLDVTKLSFHAWLNLRDKYQILDSGAALGDAGPILIAKNSMTLDSLMGKRIALPGKWTTAHLLFSLWCQKSVEKQYVTYDQIFDAIESGKADAGVIIHESRFTFQDEGFVEIVDLGKWWYEKTRLPIPLGCIAARKNLPADIISHVEQTISKSIVYARNHYETALPYIRNYAQEMEDNVLQKHIQTFVNDYSVSLGKTGKAAVDTLLKMAQAACIA